MANVPPAEAKFHEFLQVANAPGLLDARTKKAIAIALSVLATVIVVVDGESNWVEGLQLLAVYLILALAFYFVPAAR